MRQFYFVHDVPQVSPSDFDYQLTQRWSVDRTPATETTRLGFDSWSGQTKDY